MTLDADRMLKSKYLYDNKTNEVVLRNITSNETGSHLFTIILTDKLMKSNIYKFNVTCSDGLVMNFTAEKK